MNDTENIPILKPEKVITLDNPSHMKKSCSSIIY